VKEQRFRLTPEDPHPNDIRRSAAAAQRALDAVNSPHATSVSKFLDATEYEDKLLRAKVVVDKGLSAVNVAGNVVGVDALKNLNWFVIIGAGIVGFLFGLLAVANIIALVVVAVAVLVPVGSVSVYLTRQAAIYGHDMAVRISEYLSRPNEGRQLIDSVVAPAERHFFAVVQGRPPVVRSTTVSGAAAKAMVGALVAAVVLGGAAGAMVANQAGQ